MHFVFMYTLQHIIHNSCITAPLQITFNYNIKTFQINAQRLYTKAIILRSSNGNNQKRRTFKCTSSEFFLANTNSTKFRYYNFMHSLTETTGRTSALHVKILNTFSGTVCGDITNGRWVQQKQMQQQIGVTTNRCSNKQVYRCSNKQMQQQTGVVTNRCSNKQVQQQIGVVTNRCSNKQVQQQNDIATNGCSNKWMQQQIGVATNSESIFRKWRHNYLNRALFNVRVYLINIAYRNCSFHILLTNGRWVQQKIGVATNRCNNKQVQQQIGIQVQQQIEVATNRCSNKYWEATNRCSNKQVQQQNDIVLNKWMQQQIGLATNRCSNKQVQQQTVKVLLTVYHC